MAKNVIFIPFHILTQSHTQNVLLFGLSEEEKANKTAVKYKERYNALEEMATLEATLEAPQVFLKNLKLEELRELQNGEKTIARSEATSFCIYGAFVILWRFY